MFHPLRFIPRLPTGNSTMGTHRQYWFPHLFLFLLLYSCPTHYASFKSSSVGIGNQEKKGQKKFAHKMRSLSGIGAVWDWRVSKGLLFYWDDQNISSVFSISFLCCASLSLTSFKIILLDCIVTIQDGRKQQHFWYIMLYYFKKGKNGTKMQKKKKKPERKWWCF